MNKVCRYVEDLRSLFSKMNKSLFFLSSIVIFIGFSTGIQFANLFCSKPNIKLCFIRLKDSISSETNKSFFIVKSWFYRNQINHFELKILLPVPFPTSYCPTVERCSVSEHSKTIFCVSWKIWKKRLWVLKINSSFILIIIFENLNLKNFFHIFKERVRW